MLKGYKGYIYTIKLPEKNINRDTWGKAQGTSTLTKHYHQQQNV